MPVLLCLMTLFAAAVGLVPWLVVMGAARRLCRADGVGQAGEGSALFSVNPGIALTVATATMFDLAFLYASHRIGLENSAFNIVAAYAVVWAYVLSSAVGVGLTLRYGCGPSRSISVAMRWALAVVHALGVAVIGWAWLLTGTTLFDGA